MGRPRLLIVDDQLDVRLLLQAYLKKHYDVFLSEGSAELIEFIAKLKPALILLDQNLEKETGFELAKKIRETFPTHPVRIFILSGNPGLKNSLAEPSADLIEKFLTKPISAPALLAALKRQGEALDEVGQPPDFSALLPEFWKNRNSDLEDLNAQMIARDTDVVLKLVHSFKGVVMCYGFETAGELARKLEDAVRRNEWKEGEAFLFELALLFADGSAAQK